MRRSLALIVLLLIVVSACGGEDVAESTTEPAGPPPETTTSPEQVDTTAAAEPAQSVAAPELGGTNWNVGDYRLPGGGITNVWITEVTIAFSSDGTVSGTAGCNEYQGTWSVAGPWDEFESGVPDPNDGQELVLADLSWTEIACEDENVMVQEGEILDLLQRGERWVLIRGNFHLRDADGSFLFEAEPA
jgi:heat shock protein HslJ